MEKSSPTYKKKFFSFSCPNARKEEVLEILSKIDGVKVESHSDNSDHQSLIKGTCHSSHAQVIMFALAGAGIAGYSEETIVRFSNLDQTNS